MKADADDVLVKHVYCAKCGRPATVAYRKAAPERDRRIDRWSCPYPHPGCRVDNWLSLPNAELIAVTEGHTDAGEA